MTAPHCTLRPATAADVRAIAALNDAEVPRVSPLGVAGVRTMLPSCDLAVVAETDGGALAGFVFALAPGVDYASVNYRYFEERGTDHLYVDRVVVGPAWRRQGIAGQLYAAVEERARESGRAEVTCEVNVRPDNPGSRRVPQRRGVVGLGQHDTTGGTLRVALLARPVELA
ncbi:MAG: GNAT family N-acetyltransferase [Nitriliruptoraceae bacterium]|nr:GNAT family N-acetyltransferase [Nitriliruptoraceae bacterium]